MSFPVEYILDNICVKDIFTEFPSEHHFFNEVGNLCAKTDKATQPIVRSLVIRNGFAFSFTVAPNNHLQLYTFSRRTVF